MSLGAQKLDRSEPFFTTNVNFDNCCHRQTATCGKQIIYRVGQENRGHFVLRLVTFSNNDKICIKFGISQSHFILNINS